MLSVEDWAEIRRLRRAEGLPIKVIARMLNISKNTVKSALADDAPPKYERAPRGSIVDEVEPRIRELLQVYPRMPATVIAERIGWQRSIRVLSARVAEFAAGVSATGSGLTHRLRRRRGRSVRSVVSRRGDSGRLRPEPHRGPTAGADDDQRLFTLAAGHADPVAANRGSVRRVVGADQPARGGAASTGLGR